MADLRFTPTNEIQTREWFVYHLEEFGYDIIVSQEAFPDYVLADLTGKQYKVEAEFESNNFLIHRHDPIKCDFVLCWLHTASLLLPVLELSTKTFYQQGEINEDVYIQTEMQKRYEFRKRLAQSLREDVREQYDYFVDCYTLALKARYDYLSSIQGSQFNLIDASNELVTTLTKEGFKIDKTHPKDLFDMLASCVSQF